MRLLLLTLSGVWAACAPSEQTPIGLAAIPLIYGEDDRREVYEFASNTSLFEAARSVAAVIPRTRLRSLPDGTLEVVAKSLGAAQHLCPGERFSEQPAAAECTASLIDDNLLITAGHCFTDAFDCEKYLFVFDYFYTELGTFSLEPSKVFACRRAQAHRNDRPGALALRDYAIIELTRSAVGRVPLEIRSHDLEPGEALEVISTTSGVPLKIDMGAHVVDARSDFCDYFRLDSDTFHGASGAPVLDQDGALVGVIARGAKDYVYSDDSACYRTIHAPSPSEERGNLGGEEASFVTAAVESLCARRYPSMRLCGVAARCGDSICSPSEHSSTCAADCIAGPFPPLEVADSNATAQLPSEEDKHSAPFASDSAPEASGCSIGGAGTDMSGFTALLALAFGRCVVARRRLLRFS